MSTAPSYFKDFLSNIRLSDNQVNDLKTGHTTLRKRLEEDEKLSKIIISTFLQGSYRRSTAVKPKNGNKSDVDVIVVTKLDSEEYTPEEEYLSWARKKLTRAESDVVLLLAAHPEGLAFREIMSSLGIVRSTLDYVVGSLLEKNIVKDNNKKRSSRTFFLAKPLEELVGGI